MSEVKYENKSVPAEMVMVDFDTNVEKRAGGTYEGTNILFKAFGKVNEKGFTTKTYEFKPELRAQLESVSKKGTLFTMHMYRKAGGEFWNINSIEEGHVESSAPASSPAQGQAAPSFGGPNPAAVGQAMNLAVELGLCKSYSDMADVNKVRDAIIQYKAAKELFGSLWDAATNEPQPKAQESFDDDVPF